MQKQTLSLVLAAGFAWAAQGQTTLFDSSLDAYVAGDLATQNSWTEMLAVDADTGTFYPYGHSNQLGQVAFNVDNTTWVDTAGTDADFNVTTNGSYVRLDQAIGNSADDEWTFTMDFNFSIPDGPADGIEMPNSEFFYVGLTAKTNGALSRYNTNDVCFVLRTRAEAGRLDVGFQDGADSNKRILQLKPEELGWFPEGTINDGTATNAIYQTDDLRLIMNMRKTRIDNTYIAQATLTNLTAGGSYTGTLTDSSDRVVTATFSTGAYASSSLYLAMGRTSQAANFPNGLIDIDIDELSVVTENVVPNMAPANLVAAAGDTTATLMWDAIPEAIGYDVFRSTVSEVYGPKEATVTTNYYADSGLVNDIPVFYVVQAVYENSANSGNSEEKSVTPMHIYVDEELVNHGFVQSEGYTDGDLAGQVSGLWQPIAESSNHAFSVINSATTGEADTLTAGNHDAVVGNGVYLNKLIRNETGDAVDGSFTFVATAADDLGTGAANLKNKTTFTLALSEDPNSFHDDPWDGDKVMLTVCQYAGGEMAISFGKGGNVSATDRLAYFTKSELNWDPENALATKWSTDRIKVNFSIRKTYEEGVYQASAEMINLDTSVTNSGVSFMTYSRPNVYAKEAVHFTMNHFNQAKKDAGDSLVDFAIHDLSLSNSSGNEPDVLAPTALAAAGSDRTVTLMWDDMLEAIEYEVYMSEVTNMLGNLVATIPDASYADSSRFNGDELYYTVRALYVNGNDYSDQVIGTPSPEKGLYNFNGQFTGSITWAQPDPGTNATVSWYGSDTIAAADSSTGSGTYTGPIMHYLVQHLQTNAFFGYSKFQAVNGVNVFEVTSQHAASGDARGRQNIITYVKAENWLETTPLNVPAETPTFSVTTTYNNNLGGDGIRAAIRQSGQWYIGAQEIDPSGAETLTLTVDVAAEEWAPLDTDLTVTWVDPDTLTYTTDLNDTFTSVDAVGFVTFKEFKVRISQMSLVKSGSTQSFSYWADSEGVSKDGNEDGDMLNNNQEYAFGGDPNVPYADGDGAVLPEFFEPSTYNGTNGFLVTYNELRDPASGIDYYLETSDNLIIENSWKADGVEIGRVKLDYNWDSVTIFISMDTAVKFVELKVSDIETE